MKLFGYILILLSLLKIVGMIVLVSREDVSKEAIWFIKQSVYAVSFGVAGYCLIMYRKAHSRIDSSDANKAMDENGEQARPFRNRNEN